MGEDHDGWRRLVERAEQTVVWPPPRKERGRGEMTVTFRSCGVSVNMNCDVTPCDIHVS